MDIESSAERHLAVTVREMSRCAAALLDEVHATRRRIVISRYGRPAAVLAPLEDDDVAAEFRRWRAEPRYIDDLGPSKDGENDVIDLSDLDADQIGYFEAIGEAHPDRWSPGTWEQLRMCVKPIFELEVRGLVGSHSGYFWLTDRGSRALERLRGAGR